LISSGFLRDTLNCELHAISMDPDQPFPRELEGLTTSSAIDDLARAYGRRVFRTPVGEANVVETIEAVKAVIGGGGSNGGIIFPAVPLCRATTAASARSNTSTVGWIHVRSSNTEPLLRMAAEAKSNQQVDDLFGRVMEIFRSC